MKPMAMDEHVDMFGRLRYKHMAIRTKEQYESQLRLLERLKNLPKVQMTYERHTNSNYVIHISTIDRLRLVFSIKVKSVWIERYGNRLTR